MIDRSMHFFNRLHLGVASVLLVAFISPSPEPPARAEFTGQAQSYAFALTAGIDTSSATVGIADSDLYFMTEAELTRAMEEQQARADRCRPRIPVLTGRHGNRFGDSGGQPRPVHR